MAERRDYNIIIRKDGKFYVGYCLEIPQARGREIPRQIQYKAAWEGIPVRFVDPKRTSKLCPICGNKIQEDKLYHRQLWCSICKKSMDRDVVASMNISYRGLQRFCNPSGLPVEAMKRNSEMPIILRADGSKLSLNV